MNPAGVPDKVVRQFRQILLWPLELVQPGEGSPAQRHWEALSRAEPDNPWREVADEFTGDPAGFQERHYSEFVTFLPYVQRFLYGEVGPEDCTRHSPMRVFRRTDVARVRVALRSGETPIEFSIAHIDLYFFFDLDIVLLNVEIAAADLTLRQVQETLYRFGRAYPPGWEADGRGLHCPERVEWLGADGRILAASDTGDRDRYLRFVCEHRAPRFDAHWTHLLMPFAPQAGGASAAIHYRQIEYYRMPVMAYLAMEDPRSLSRADFVRLGLVTDVGAGDSLPFSDQSLADFETRHCLDRYWSDRPDGPNTRHLCCGHALVVVGDAHSSYFTDAEHGVLAQFRHQHYLLFLIAHFQKAALLMFSARLVDALAQLDVTQAQSVKRFKRVIRLNFETFLRFTHRYWFHEIADQAQARALFELCARHLGLDPLYAEVKERMADMNTYLESDTLRRQANTVIRLTVVTVFGLIGTTLTGFFGMNVLAFGEGPLAWRLAAMGIATAVVCWFMLMLIARSKRLSDFLEALSDERLSVRQKLRALGDVWRRRAQQRP